MEFETYQTSAKSILDCEIKDENGLSDFQKLPDEQAIAIHKVGIERFRIPLLFVTQEGQRSHDAEASMFVNLEQGKTGVNMSRFCQILQDLAQKYPVDSKFFEMGISRFRSELRDYGHEEPKAQAYLELSFSYPMKQPSLKSENWGWQYYKCRMRAQNLKTDQLLYTLTVEYEYSSTCPCSLAMAKQYEREFIEGKTQQGNGIATAHGQRSLATCDLTYSSQAPLEIEEVILRIRKAIPTETQSLVKRVDEQAFAILNGENPLFVEHASRRLANAFNSDPKILDWKVKVEHFESLHSHNAVAYIQKT